jgi:mycothiol synthase
MEGLTSRPLLATDAPALLEIELAAERVEPAQNYVDLAEIQENLSMPGVDLAGGSIAVFSGDAMVGTGFLHIRPAAKSWDAHLSGGVLPHFRRGGIGRLILSNLQEKALTLRAAGGHGDLPGVLRLWVPEGRDAVAAFAAAAGFTHRRYFLDMRAGLDAVGALPKLVGIEIREWTPADDEATRLAYNAAFADHWGSTPMDPERWRTSFAGSAFFRPEFSRVALTDGEVVGFVLVAEFPSETEVHGYRTGYIDRVGSVRSVRGRGVAAALLTDSMTALARSGCRYAELGVDADSPTGAGRLYERLGYSLLHTNQVLGLDF